MQSNESDLGCMRYRVVGLLLFASIPVALSSKAQVSDQDSLALVALFHATGGENWRQAEPQSSGSWRDGPNWLNGPVNTWHSVRVTDGRVTKIYTELLFMSGELPPEIGDLTALTELFITHDQALTGAIPDEIGKLISLRRLAIYGTGIDAPIPSSIGQLKELEDLELPFNKLSGAIPSAIGELSKLEELSLMDNELTGVVPTELERLASLKYLDLQDNVGLSGPLPIGLMHLDQLRWVSIENTGICGPLDPAFQAWLEQVAGVTQSSCPVSNTEVDDAPVALSIEETFPNPVSNRLTVRYNSPFARRASLELVDTLGRNVMGTHVENNGPGPHLLSIDVSELAAGIYHMRLHADGQFATRTVVVIRN